MVVVENKALGWSMSGDKESVRRQHMGWSSSTEEIQERAAVGGQGEGSNIVSQRAGSDMGCGAQGGHMHV